MGAEIQRSRCEHRLFRSHFARARINEKMLWGTIVISGQICIQTATPPTAKHCVIMFASSLLLRQKQSWSIGTLTTIIHIANKHEKALALLSVVVLECIVHVTRQQQQQWQQQEAQAAAAAVAAGGRRGSSSSSSSRRPRQQQQ